MSIERWDIDSSRSRIAFAVRHLVFSKTRGHFSRWSGTVTIPDGDCSRATVDVVIAASSIDTGVARRDEHLRSADYLDVTRFPEITFTAQTVQAMPEGHFRVVGALTLRGVTREVALDVAPLGPAADPRSSHRARLAATATLDRRDFEFTGNPALDSGGLVIGERIVVEVEVEAVRKPAARVA
jgi:polyisoprenoid-binding protein YceI